MCPAGDDRSLRIKLGREELVIRQRYEVVSIANDILIAVWFTIGSVMFFSPEWTTLGTWFFLLGSVQLLIRPAIRLSRHLHLRRVRGMAPGTTGQSGQEF
ncbi:hypothetical protein F4561_002589 [Lipingzhangella halophila]|uniref:YrhK domain-containing protein n=1 Tax=Lipingzhangella halophila TaxID=1783352 RepID=A0A7W7W3G1_9ACTN|nr:YrhK family protein [Lipingzhangella halophila]MBB4931769.1 hypothetical protein [Lipingzhangella halophila]